MSITQAAFLAEFEDQHFPRLFGPWVRFDDHDPPFSIGQLRQMKRQGVIDLDEINGRYRLTLKATEARP